MNRRINIIGIFLIIAGAVFCGCYLFLVNWIFMDSPKEETSDRVYQVSKYQIREKIYKYSRFPDSSFDYKYDRVYTIVENGWLPMEVARFEYTDRRNIGIKTAHPKMVGEWLVIFSDRQTFLWKPNHQLIKFTPDETTLPELAKSPIGVYPTQKFTPNDTSLPNLDETTLPKLFESPIGVSPTQSKNIYLDYQPINFLIQGDRWLFEYHCDRNCQDGLNNQIPPKLVCSNNEKLSLDDCKIVPNIYPNPPKVVFLSKDRGKTFQILKKL